MADVIIYLYDSSDANSFSYLANIRVSSALRFPLQGVAMN